jgi:hypothetical protein
MRHAANRDLGEAQLAYAIYLRQGIGVPKNAGKAILWLERARAAYILRMPHRWPMAKRRRKGLASMAFLASGGRGNPLDRALAIRLYGEAQTARNRRPAQDIAQLRKEIEEIKAARAAGRKPWAKITGCEGFARRG